MWGIQFRRDILAAGEAVDWSWTPATQAGNASQFGHLIGLENLEEPARLEILPYVLGKGAFDQRADAANPFDDGSLFDGSAGVDLKYGVSSALTLDVTVNPDFGQVEADPAVVNLTAFETFFQERRPFFVEGSDIFTLSFPFWPPFFYSRRIGRAPQGPGPSDAAFQDRPAATTISGAVKLTGKTDDGWSIGVIDAVTGVEHDDVVARADEIAFEDRAVGELDRICLQHAGGEGHDGRTENSGHSFHFVPLLSVFLSIS